MVKQVAEKKIMVDIYLYFFIFAYTSRSAVMTHKKAQKMFINYYSKYGLENIIREIEKNPQELITT